MVVAQPLLFITTESSLWLSFNFDYNVDDYSDKYNLLKIRRHYPLDLGNTIRPENDYLFSDSEIFKSRKN